MKRVRGHKGHQKPLKQASKSKKRDIIRVPVLAEPEKPPKDKILEFVNGLWRLKLTRDQNMALDWLFKKYGEKGGSLFGQPNLDNKDPMFKMCVFPHTATKAICQIVNFERMKLK